MQSLLKRLIKMVAGYGMVQWAGPFLSLIFTPIITRILNPADYGVADYVLTISSAIGVVALLAIPQALTAHFNDHPEIDWQRRVTGSALTIAVVVGIVVGIGLVVYAPVLADLAPITHGYAYLFQWMGATAVLGLSGAILTSVAQAALRVRWGMALSITTILGTILGNVLFIIVLRLGVTGMVLTPIVTGVLTFVVAFALAHRMIGRPSATITQMLLRTGMWLLPATLAGWVLQVADRFFLAQSVSAQELGYYAIANRIATLLYVAIAPFLTAYTPLALAMQHEPQAKERYATLARYLVAVVLCAGLGLGLFATEMLIVLTRESYLPAAVYVGFLTYIHTFGAVNLILYTSGLASKQFKGITWTILVGAAVNLLLNFILIPPYGVWGATIATVISYAVPPILLYLWLQPRYPVPYPVAKIVGAIAIQFALLVIGLALPPLPFLTRIVLKGFIWVLLPLSFIPLGMITPFEFQQARLLAQREWTNRIVPFVRRDPTHRQ